MKRAIVIVAAAIQLFAISVRAEENKTPTFTVTVMGEMEDKAATKTGFRTYLFDYAHLAFTNLDSSNGEKVTVYHAQFRRASEAERYFDWILKKDAAQIIRQEGKTDLEGKVVGRKAEFLLKSDGNVKEWEIMWTDNVHFILISAPTVECAEELERQSTK